MDREEFNTNSRVEELEEKNAQLVMELEHVHSLYDVGFQLMLTLK